MTCIGKSRYCGYRVLGVGGFPFHLPLLHLPWPLSKARMNLVLNLHGTSLASIVLTNLSWPNSDRPRSSLILDCQRCPRGKRTPLLDYCGISIIRKSLGGGRDANWPQLDTCQHDPKSAASVSMTRTCQNGLDDNNTHPSRWASGRLALVHPT